MKNKGFDISQLQDLARRAESTRLTAGARGRILRAVEADRGRSRSWMTAGFPGMTFGRALGAAAVLVVLALPAALYRGPARGAPRVERDLNLTARLQSDGSLVLEWQNGTSVHTVRRASTTAGLAKVDGIKVAGGRFVDEASPVGEIVYYQID